MEKKLPLIICVDFDDTVIHCNPDYSIGDLRPHAKDVINKFHKQGIYIIIWTCRTGETQLDAEIFLKENGINYDKINDQSCYTYKDWPHAGRKAYADIYIDDKSIEAIRNGELPSWHEIDTIVQSKLESGKWTNYPDTDYRYAEAYKEVCKYCNSDDISVEGWVNPNDDTYELIEEGNAINHCNSCHREDVI